MKRPAEYFRAGVGAVVIDHRGWVLALERTNIPGAWQFPQGGLKRDEEPMAAVYREVGEETGIAQCHLELLEVAPDLLAYELPPEARSEKTGRGQVLQWYIFRFQGGDSDIEVGSGDEFRAWKWMPFPEMLAFTVEFRRPVYRRLGELFGRFFHGDKLTM